ncbi:hypothetical protein CLOP_g10651 [Closterium sp. NIES-67]|nr:hypothetical protein CLOP_g10651 [Closterium sp. NIES-67]
MAERSPARPPTAPLVSAPLPVDSDCLAISPRSLSPPTPSLQPACIPRRVKASGAVDSSERARHRRPRVPKWDREEADEEESLAGGSSVAPSEGSGGSCEPWSMEDHSAATATATPTPPLASASPDAGLDELLADFAQLLSSSHKLFQAGAEEEAGSEGAAEASGLADDAAAVGLLLPSRSPNSTLADGEREGEGESQWERRIRNVTDWSRRPASACGRVTVRPSSAAASPSSRLSPQEQCLDDSQLSMPRQFTPDVFSASSPFSSPSRAAPRSLFDDPMLSEFSSSHSHTRLNPDRSAADGPAAGADGAGGEEEGEQGEEEGGEGEEDTLSEELEKEARAVSGASPEHSGSSSPNILVLDASSHPRAATAHSSMNMGLPPRRTDHHSKAPVSFTGVAPRAAQSVPSSPPVTALPSPDRALAAARERDKDSTARLRAVGRSVSMKLFRSVGAAGAAGPGASRPPLPRGLQGQKGGSEKDKEKGGGVGGSSANAVVSCPEWEQLYGLAKRIAKDASLAQCGSAYRSARLVVLQEAVQAVGVESLEGRDLQSLPWGDMEQVLRRWLHDTHALVAVQLDGERALFASVIGRLGVGTLGVFTALLTDSGLVAALRVLAANASALLATPNLPEKLFAYLDAFWLCRSSVASVEEAAKAAEDAALAAAWVELPGRLAKAATSCIDEVVTMLRASAGTSTALAKRSMSHRLRLSRGSKGMESSGEGQVDATVHPITSYVVNYVRQIMDKHIAGSYGCILQAVIEEHFPERTSVEAVGMKVLEALEANLEGKALRCHDDTTKTLFFVNNFTYICNHLSDSPFKCTQSFKQKQERNAETFATLALSKLHGALGPKGHSQGYDRGEIRNRLKRFNRLFEELALQQKDWVITDDKSRKEVRRLLGASIKDHYMDFLTPHRDVLTDIPTYQWTPDGIERMVLKSFLLGRGAVPFATSM